MCAALSSAFSTDEAAEGKLLADELRAIFACTTPSQSTMVSVAVADVKPTLAMTVTTSRGEDVIARAVRPSGDTRIQHQPRRTENPQSLDAFRRAIITNGISPEMGASRALAVDQLDLATKDLLNVTEYARASAKPTMIAISMGLAHATSRIADAFCLIEDWVAGAPLSIKTFPEFPDSTSCVTYMERICQIGEGGYGDKAHTDNDEDPRPVRVSSCTFACPYADPSTHICTLGRFDYKPGREVLVQKHIRTQHKKHKPSANFVSITTDP